MKVILAVIALVLMISPLSPAQEGANDYNLPKLPTFDVISVKMNQGDPHRRMSQFTPDGFSMINMPVHTLLTQAFQVDADQIINEPGWATVDRWDIQAKMLDPTDVVMLGKMSFDQRRAMLVQILTDRFGLKIHHDTRELSVYALVVAKGGPRMAESKPDPNLPSKGAPPNITGPDGKLVGRGVSPDILAEELSWDVGRTVVDKTGLRGRYDFTLRWIPDIAGRTSTAASARDGEALTGDQIAGESLFTAIQEQLGLRLRPTKASVDVVVIDQIKKPTDN